MTSALLLRAARRKTSMGFLLLQAGLVAVMFLLFMGWLFIPDAHVVQVVLSALLAVVLLLIAAGGEAWLLLRVLKVRPTRMSLLRGGVAILLAGVLLFLVSSLLDHVGLTDSLRAGYLNSQLSAGMRHVLTYSRLMTILQQTWDAIFWAAAIVFVMAAVAITITRGPLRAFGAMLQSATAWFVLSLATIVASEASLKLLHWTPGHGLGVETASLVLRIAVVVVVDTYMLCFSLSLLILLAEESDRHYFPAVTDAGTPDRSQPRTVPAP